MCNCRNEFNRCGRRDDFCGCRRNCCNRGWFGCGCRRRCGCGGFWNFWW